MLRTLVRCLIANVAVAASLVVAVHGNSATADDAVPANPAPRWWKGNLHTHTLWSDGDDFPEMVAEWYRTRDYNFLALTDHNVLSQGTRWVKESTVNNKGGPSRIIRYVERFGDAWVERRGSGEAREIRLKPFDEYRALIEERGKFLLIPAEEISDKAEGGPVHINAANLLEPVQPLGGATVVEAITNNLRNVHEQAERAGREILAHLNHPNFRYAITAEDIAHAVLERHFEVYNGHPGTNQLGDELHPGVERLWDIANTIRLVDLNAPPLFGIATDDSHVYPGEPKGSATGSRPGRGWVMVRTTHLTPEHIVRAIKAGDCYASSGVTLAEVRYDAESKTLDIQIQPDGDAGYVTQFIGTLRGVETTAEQVEPPPAKDPKTPPPRLSRKYSDKIGEVFQTTAGLQASYTLTGKELYVRAVVTSTKSPVDPSFPGQKQQAWTQPVGWSVAK